MNLDYYNFKQNPFPTTPDVDHLFLSPSHHAALMAMIDGVQKRKGIVVITGREGVGKTTLLRSFLHRADPKTLKTLCIQPPTVSYSDLVAMVAQALGLDAPTDDVEAFLAQLHAALQGEYQAGRNMVLVIDEAQNMPLDTLASLSRFVTLEDSQVKLLQIVMVGSLELEKKLNRRALRSLKRHVAAHATMVPLTKTESLAYIRDHLAKAAEEPDTIFSLKALKHIVKRTRGVPRMLNILCVDALQMGAYYYEQPISAKTIKNAAAGNTSLAPRFSRQLVATMGTVATMVGFGLLWVSLPKTFFTVQTSASNATPPDPSPLVATSNRVAPAQSSFPSTGDEGQVTKVHSQPSLLRPRIEAADGQDKDLEALPYSVSERQTSDRLAEEEKQVATDQAPTADWHAAPVTTPPEPGTDPLLGMLQQPSSPEVVFKLERSLSPSPQPHPERQAETPRQDSHPGMTQRVVDLIQQHFPNGGAFPLRVWANKGAEEVYTQGENLLVHVVSEQSAHLQVDYYQADGQVVHLLPHPLDSNRVKAGEIFSLGKPDNAFQFEVVPPFGVEMLTVVASRSPLDASQGGPTIEPAAQYLERFSKRLQAYKAQGNAAIAHIRIRTRKSP